jgi:putative nucleotidyltransferase with HDIG domain
MNGKRRSGRKTVGVLVDYTVDPYQQIFLKGVMDYCTEQDVNCIAFEGGGVGSPHDYESQRNGIYRLANSSLVDGLVVMAGSIDHLDGNDGSRVFFRQSHPLPVVGVSVAIENATTVSVDNRTGMSQLLLHLIEQHGFRRFGFLAGRAGNLDAEDRLAIFREVLEAHDIPVDPQWIIAGDMNFISGIEAAKGLIARGVSNVDVLVAANDSMAIGVMHGLSQRGVQVPSQIAVTGFDDINLVGSSESKLTTVRLPVYEQARKATQLLMDRIEGRAVPQKVSLPTSLIIRNSCGCRTAIPLLQEPAAEERFFPVESTADDRTAVRRYLQDMVRSFAAYRADLDPESVVSALEQAFWKGNDHGDPRPFLTAFQETVYRPLSHSVDFAAVQGMLSDLWNCRRGEVSRRSGISALLDLSFHAVLSMGQAVAEIGSDNLEALLQEKQALEVTRELTFTKSVSGQMDLLARRVVDMGFESCYVSLFRHDPHGGTQQSVCIMGVRNRKRVALGPNGKEFPSRQLVPDRLLSDRQRHMVIVEAMKQFGFFVCEMGRWQNRFLSYFADIISSSVQAALLYRELKDQKNDLDRNLSSIRAAMAGFIQTMAATVESRDPYTAGHQRRVSDLARTIAQEMGLSPAQVDCVRMAGIVHDLGKIYIPAEILNRAGVLDDVEWSLIKKHPKVAWDILKNIDFPWPIAETVHQHHERLNGKGYPNGLKGNSVRLEARILAVADVVEAMSSHRPYREALGIERALEEINRNKGRLYDPKVVDACTALFRTQGYTFKA